MTPFLSDKKCKGNNTIILNEENQTITEPNMVAEMFNTYFISIALEIGFPDSILSTDEAINTHNHPYFSLSYCIDYLNVKKSQSYLGSVRQNTYQVMIKSDINFKRKYFTHKQVAKIY